MSHFVLLVVHTWSRLNCPFRQVGLVGHLNLPVTFGVQWSKPLLPRNKNNSETFYFESEEKMASNISFFTFDSLLAYQCDQTNRLFVNKPSKIALSLLNFLPKWQNFAKYGHTVAYSLVASSEWREPSRRHFKLAYFNGQESRFHFDLTWGSNDSSFGPSG